MLYILDSSKEPPSVLVAAWPHLLKWFSLCWALSRTIYGIFCFFTGAETFSCVVQKPSWYTLDNPKDQRETQEKGFSHSNN